MKVVILAGGVDTRLSEETTLKPKPMVEIGGIMMVLMGLIGEYVGRIFICINDLPQYVVRETINIDSK